MKFITKNIEGIDITFKVSDDGRQAWVLLDDNFALAEGFFTLRQMLEAFIKKAARSHKRWCEVGKSMEKDCYELLFKSQSKVVEVIADELKQQV